MIDYKRALVLAPMVRVGELPTRLLSLKHGATLVWTPEIIDKKIINCQRVWNEPLKCVDFVEPASPSNNNQNNPNRLAFRTCPSREKSKLVFQMGTADPDLAVQAALKIVNDVSAIDVNSGCPKHFSIHSGMGAALLRTPDKLVSILTSLVSKVGIPNNIPISVKIRLLETEEKTLELVSRLVQTGIKCLTVHCRTTPMRPREPAIRNSSLKKIVDVCHKAGVACLVNGDVEAYKDLDDLIKTYGVDGAMIARGAEANPSCFNPAGPVPWYTIATEFFALCKEFSNHVVNTKFCLARMIPGKSPVYQQVAQSRTMEQLESVLQKLQDDQDEEIVKMKKKFESFAFKSPLRTLLETQAINEKARLRRLEEEKEKQQKEEEEKDKKSEELSSSSELKNTETKPSNKRKQEETTNNDLLDEQVQISKKVKEVITAL